MEFNSLTNTSNSRNPQAPNISSYWTNRCEEIALFLNSHYFDIKIEMYILLVIVAIGILGNIINVVIYSHKKMNSPINLIFQALAYTDLFLLIIYMIEKANDLNSNTEIALRVPELNVKSLIFFFLIFRLSALWLTTALTYWRWVALAHPLQNRIRCDLASCRKSVIFIYLLSFCVNLPFVFLKRASNLSVVEKNEEDTSFFLWLYLRGKIYFWFYRSLLILFSMALLIVMSIGLFIHVKRTRSSRKDLSMSTNGRKSEQMIRINKMILTVGILYLITEFLCIMSCLNRVSILFIKSNFYTCVDSIRILKLSIFMNPCINTLCYMLMSSQYRHVLKSTFRTSTLYF